MKSAVSAASVGAGVVPELQEERARASFSVEEMTHFLHGGRAAYHRAAFLDALLEVDHTFSKRDELFMPRTELYARGAARVARVQQLARMFSLSDAEQASMRLMMDTQTPTELHYSMFIPALMGMCTPEQQAKWVPMARELRIIGTYAQTELGHGSFIRGLETTATYDPTAQEFVMHSPTLTATKWWPGALGRSSTHAVVMARLVTGGKDRGIHAFIVQLRSLEDHMPLPGVTVGDIGPKFGYRALDNGFLRLDHVRIPREHMLMRHASVATDGTYTPAPNRNLSYGTMLFVRAMIVRIAYMQLARAVTVAVRYSAVRRQFPEGSTGRERKVLDYQTQQYRLLSRLATTYALFFTGDHMLKLYQRLQKQLQQDDLSALPEVHATSCGLKALVTWLSTEGIEDCRQSCGGHGYSRFSGLVDLYDDWIASCTYEGDNWVVMQQTTRYLVKVARKVAQGASPDTLPPAVRYIAAALRAGADGGGDAKCAATSPEDLQRTDVLLAAMEQRAGTLVAACTRDLAAAMADGAGFDAAWDSVRLQSVRAGRAHCELTMARNFAAGVRGAPKALQPVLARLCALHLLTVLEADPADLLASGYLAPHQLPWLRRATLAQVRALRPDAVPLADGFGLSDRLLNSALGRYDGRCYEALYAWAQREPMNAKQVLPAFEEHLRPVLQQRVWPPSKL